MDDHPLRIDYLLGPSYPAAVEQSLSAVRECLIPLDLGAGKLSKIGPCLERTVPFDNPFERRLQRKHWMPTQARLRLGGIQLESVGLSGMRRRILSPSGAVPPRPNTLIRNPRL